MTSKTGRPATFTVLDVVTAYEMRNDGVCWKLISRYLGGKQDTLQRAVIRAERFGLNLSSKL